MIRLVIWVKWSAAARISTFPWQTRAALRNSVPARRSVAARWAAARTSAHKDCA